MSYSKTEHYDPKITGQLLENFKTILEGIGEDVSRDGLLKTPQRAAKAMQYMTQGYNMDAEKILRSAMFDEDYSEMVVVKDIEIYSLCEHHMLPFLGKAHVAYIPNGRIVGLSKIPRVCDVFARRLQVQERLTLQIVDVIDKTLQPQGVAVVIEAMHMCVTSAGRTKQNSVTTTSRLSWKFQKVET
ncbi:MAG: GTP cyclohydrolase I FolE [Saprospiraceae bacterium]